jgi:hypothetical protein
MRIEILSVDTSSSETRVRFASDHGDANARWSGAPPAVGDRYDVELDASTRLTWGRDLVVRVGGDYRLTAHGERGAVIDATLEMFDAEDGVASLRIGPSVMLISTRGDAPAVGSAVRATIDELVLTDTGN